MSDKTWDIIVVGGGLAGSVVSSRLSEFHPNLRILLIEAGPDVTDNTRILDVASTPLLVGSEWDWQDTTVRQDGLGNRVVPNPSGKALGGGTVINSCGWIRGHRADFDEWADIVEDQRWSYDGQLPYFRKAENVVNPDVDQVQHGVGGPITAISVSTTGRRFPLRDAIRRAWQEVGMEFNQDANGGDPIGVGELNENRKSGLRQIASSSYSLKGVTVLSNTLVKKVHIAEIGGFLRATGVELVDGTSYNASKEVILSAGAYRTPQLLMLSGIGPKDHLSSHSIATLVDLPDVGENLMDHVLYSMYWQLRHPEEGLAVGSSNTLFAQPEFAAGGPVDWVTTTTLPENGLRKAIEKDEGATPSSTHPLLKADRAFMETLVLYAAMSPANPVVPFDGSHVTTTLVGLTPTSKGSVRLASADPREGPLIDPKYHTTEVDRYAFREGLRNVAKLFLGTPTGKTLIVKETPPDKFVPLSQDITDEEIDARIAHSALTCYHPMGTAAMGRVVDNNLFVKGVGKLRVVDASIFPTVIAAHIQQAVYALAEQAAEIIGSEI